MNEDLNIYDGRTIEGSSEAKSRSSWVEMFDMIDLAINNLQQQNKDLKRQVNELNSKLNKVSRQCLCTKCKAMFFFKLRPFQKTANCVLKWAS